MKRNYMIISVILMLGMMACSKDNPIMPQEEIVAQQVTAAQIEPGNTVESSDTAESEPPSSIPQESQDYPSTVSGYVCTLEWGEKGIFKGEFWTPTFIALDGRKLYISDFGNNRVHVFDREGCFLGQLGEYGKEEGNFKYPQGIAIDSSSSVYIADIENNCIQKFTQNGIFLKRWSARNYAEEFTPSGIAISDGRLYAADSLNHRIRIFTLNGTLLDEWGNRESDADGQFHYPNGIAIDKSGYVYVADFGNNRIQKFDSDGNFLTKWGSKGNKDRQFNGPCNVAVDNRGNVYVADTYNYRIQKFNDNGGFITKWTSDDGQMEPYGIAIDSSGNVYISDSSEEGSRILKFSPT